MFLFLFAACEPAPSPTDSAGEGDTDSDTDTDTDTDTDADTDGRDNAESLEADVAAGGTIDAEDVNWYAISGIAGQPFRLQVTNPAENSSEEAFDSVVAVYDSDLSRIAWEDEHPAGDVSTYDSVCFGFFPTDGTYYATVSDRRTFEGSESPVESSEYTLTLVTSATVPDEPDSLLSIDVGGEFSSDNAWYGFPVLIDEQGDSDFILVQPTHENGAIAVVTAQHIEGSAAIPLVRGYDYTGKPIFSADTTAASDGRQILYTLSTTYVIEVASAAAGGGNDHGAWIFLLSREEGYGNPRETSGNDSVESADVLTMKDLEPTVGWWWAGYGEGHIDTEDDADYFRFDVYNDDSYLHVAFGAQSYGSLALGDIRLLDSSGAELGRSTADPGVDPELQNLGPYNAGEYWVRIAGVPPGDEPGSGTGEAGAYRFAAHVTSVPL